MKSLSSAATADPDKQWVYRVATSLWALMEYRYAVRGGE